MKRFVQFSSIISLKFSAYVQAGGGLHSPNLSWSSDSAQVKIPKCLLKSCCIFNLEMLCITENVFSCLILFRVGEVIEVYLGENMQVRGGV